MPEADKCTVTERVEGADEVHVPGIRIRNIISGLDEADAGCKVNLTHTAASSFIHVPEADKCLWHISA